ncbi:hypothetical protein PSN13_06539 [Micromonospora saelicesensis]|uniref:Uncharacterized protein n=1 Tax=Micromonospora saelicesensis TaxID=285676 RepID=A0A328NIN5_9ACTN|nr:hypothetical protein [Micromonospora saelicesensis]RAO26511.1 hypothetical protein PSN13_06539 [Micromonospora saelicesensis]
MSPRILDLGDVIAHFQPGPTSPPPTGPGTGSGSRPGPRVTSLLDDTDRTNADKLGRLDYLISEMQYVARVDGCPPALANLIAEAGRITGAGA